LASCALAACAGGSDAGGPGTGGSAVTPTSQPDSGYVVSDQLVSQTAGNGTVAKVATPLPDQAAVDAFTHGLADPLAAKVVQAVEQTQVASGQRLYGQVVAVGCDVPPAVTVERDREIRLLAVEQRVRAQSRAQPEHEVVHGLASEQELACPRQKLVCVLRPLDVHPGHLALRCGRGQGPRTKGISR